MIKALLWDNDGVLVDTERLFYNVNRQIFAEYGIELSALAFFDWFLRDNCGGWHLFRAKGHSEEFIMQLRQRRNRLFSDVLSMQADLLVEGMSDVLAALAPIAGMALVTSSSREHLELAHRNSDLLRYFRVIVTEEDCAFTKPSPAPYLLAMTRLNVAPAECIAIEDSPRGVAAANAAGVKCIVLASDLAAHHQFEGAHEVVGGSAELLTAIGKLL